MSTVLQAVTEEQQDSCQNFITPGSDEVPQKSMDEDAHQGDPADTAEEYNSATAAAFPFPHAEASKDELSTPAHRCVSLCLTQMSIYIFLRFVHLNG